MGAAFIDINNGGRLSLFRAGSSNSLFLGTTVSLLGTNLAAAYGFESSAAGTFGFAVADYDNDGDMDVVTSGGLYRNSYYRTGPVSISGTRWINVALDDPGSMNHRGIGAILRLKTSNGAMQTREIHAGSSHGSTNSFVQHFGLEVGGPIDSLVVQWPSGCKQVLLRSQIKPGEANTVQKGSCVSGHTISGVVTDS